MAEKDKKYYWLKLKRDFFKRHDIQIIEDMPNGKDYILFYLKLLCESVDHDGNLRFNEEIPYNEEMLSTITRTNIDTVRSAVKVFTQLQMLEVLEDGTIYMREVQKMLGSETYWAEQKRIQRKGRTLIGQSPTCPSKSIEIEKEIDTDTEIEIEKEKEIINKKETTNIGVDVAAVFNGMLEEVKSEITHISFITFFSNALKCKGIRGNRIVLYTPSIMADVIDSRFRNVVIAALKNASNGEIVGYEWGEEE